MKTIVVDGIEVDVEGDADPEKVAAFVRKQVAAMGGGEKEKKSEKEEGKED